jgi:hypothetical protein
MRLLSRAANEYLLIPKQQLPLGVFLMAKPYRKLKKANHGSRPANAKEKEGARLEHAGTEWGVADCRRRPLRLAPTFGSAGFPRSQECSLGW